MLTSQLCSYASLTSPELEAWARRLRPMWDPGGQDPKPRLVHRKMWEWLFIAQALAERRMLEPGRRGLGFGVGREPLVALFAADGCELLATDLDPAGAGAAGWTDSGEEYSGGLEGLNEHRLCPPDDFARRVAYRHLDMNRLPDDLGQFDFTWSSCAFEHLGSLEAGAEFVVGQMRFVRPGGVAVHTTEFNVASDDRTVEEGATVLYRRRDVEALARRLRRLGFSIELDLRPGTAPEDRHVDVPPFTDTHLRTTLGEFVTTSLGLIVERPAGGPSRATMRWWALLGRRRPRAARDPGAPAA
ncbi:MAG: methyltransferase domain-containing protein [Acidimicrobiales bacterium]